MSEHDMPSYLMPLSGFRSRKAAQVCAFFAVKSSGIIDKLKLIKLIYMAERSFLHEHHMPILYDELFSLPHGPICSSTLNGINGHLHEEIWGEFLARNGNQAVAMKSFSRDDLDELSDIEYSYLDDAWKKFGHMTASQLRNYSHENCSEYTEVHSGRVPISYADVLRAFDDDEAQSVDEEIKQFRRAESVFF